MPFDSHAHFTRFAARVALYAIVIILSAGTLELLSKRSSFAIGHRHVNGHDEIALSDHDRSQRVTLNGRGVRVLGHFGGLRDGDCREQRSQGRESFHLGS